MSNLFPTEPASFTDQFATLVAAEQSFITEAEQSFITEAEQALAAAEQAIQAASAAMLGLRGGDWQLSPAPTSCHYTTDATVLLSGNVDDDGAVARTQLREAIAVEQDALGRVQGEMLTGSGLEGLVLWSVEEMDRYLGMDQEVRGLLDEVLPELLARLEALAFQLDWWVVDEDVEMGQGSLLQTWKVQQAAGRILEDIQGYRGVRDALVENEVVRPYIAHILPGVDLLNSSVESFRVWQRHFEAMRGFGFEFFELVPIPSYADDVFMGH